MNKHANERISLHTQWYPRT